jgi:transposase-like protein
MMSVPDYIGSKFQYPTTGSVVVPDKTPKNSRHISNGDYNLDKAEPIDRMGSRKADPMTANLQNPIFTDETKAREWLEARVWPNGPVCPHCGATGDDVTALNGKAHRPGLYQCSQCREQFTVTVKTVFERSKLPLSKWLAALFMLTASKKGISAHQIHRSLGISYKSAWFMMHRLREALRQGNFSTPMGSGGKTVEVDETYFGKQAGHAKGKRQGHMNAVLTLVERGGKSRTFHVDGTALGDLAPVLRANLAREAKLGSELINFSGPTIRS